MKEMTPELWKAKKIVDSTLHPDTGEPVFLPFRMSCFVLSNLVVTVGMLTPNLGVCSLLAQFLQCGRLTAVVEQRNDRVADRQPVSERGDQLLQLEQVLAPVLVQDREVVLPRRRRVLRCGRGVEQPRTPTKACLALDEAHPREIGALRGGG
jgi:hypothetical protein